MTPIERLQAAIEKLERLKAECTPGEWGFESIPETGESRIYLEADGFAFMAATTVTFYPVPGGLMPNDADLIVTLHRTIDAQLAIMRAATERGAAAVGAGGIERFVWSREHRAVALAEAILGSTS